jgi:hypothetical protein
MGRDVSEHHETRQRNVDRARLIKGSARVSALFRGSYLVRTPAELETTAIVHDQMIRTHIGRIRTCLTPSNTDTYSVLCS